MSLSTRNAVQVAGSGPATLLFAHGFGCDQNMWRLLAPAYASRFRTVLYDLTGSGRSDLTAYDRQRYATLHGHASDAVEIAREFGRGPVVFVGHSVSSMVGLLANLQAPDLFAAQVMVGPSPCYINDGAYFGGFERKDIEGLLETLESNYLGWSSTMAPAIMGAPDRPHLAQELTNSFCRTDPDVARRFARATFLSDNRADLEGVNTRALILQCSEDVIAPREVGEYVHGMLPNSQLVILKATGHCPNLSAPQETVEAIKAFV